MSSNNPGRTIVLNWNRKKNITRHSELLVLQDANCKSTCNRIQTTHDAESKTEESHVAKVEGRLKQSVHSEKYAHIH